MSGFLKKKLGCTEKKGREKQIRRPISIFRQNKTIYPILALFHYKIKV